MAKKIEMLNDQQEVVHPLTSSDCVIMENGKTLEEVMGDGIATPTVTHEGASFQVGVGDSNIEVVDGDVAGMTLEGQTYQNILPKPTTLIMETDEKEFKINDKIDNNIVLDDNVAEIATIKGQTYVNVVQEESASEYVAIDEELNGQSITTTGKPEGYVKNATLEGLTLVNTIQEPSGADVTVLDLDADIDAQYATIGNTVQGGIHGAILKGQTLVNLFDRNYLTTEGLSYTFNNGIYSITSTYSWSKLLFKVNLKNNTKYIFFGITSVADCEVYYRIDGVASKICNFNQFPFIFTTPDNKIDSISIGFPSIVTDATVSYLMLIEYQEGMENWDIPYFEGMKSVEVPSVKTTGKNLFDGQLESGIINEHDGSLSNTSDYKRTVNYIEINPNKQYMLRVNGAVNGRCFYYDGDKKYISSSLATSNGLTNIPMNAKYMKVRFNANDIADKQEIQLTYGTQVTPYEPYQSSTLTCGKMNLDGSMIEQGSFYDSFELNTQTYQYIKVPSTADDFYVDRIRSKGTYKVFGGDKYSVKLNSGYAMIFGFCKNGLYSAKTNGWTTSTETTITVPNDCDEMFFAIKKTSEATINPSEFSNVGLEIRHIVTLRKVGDVQDELDLETGKLTQRIGEVIVDNNKNWDIHTINQNTILFASYGCIPTVPSDDLVMLSDKYVIKKGFPELLASDEEQVHAYQDRAVYIRVLRTKLPSQNVDGLKQWLSNNPFTIQYKEKTPIVKTISTTVKDQSNNSLKTIQTQPTLTHITTSSNGLIPFVSIPSQLKYPTIIKPSTTYTVQLKQTTVNSEFPLAINLGGTTMAVPSTKFTITTPETLTSQDVIFTGKNNVIGEVVITEGDTTGIDYKFFEGMNDVKSPKMYATGKNLFDISKIILCDGITINNNSITIENKTIPDNIIYLFEELPNETVLSFDITSENVNITSAALASIRYEDDTVQYITHYQKKYVNTKKIKAIRLHNWCLGSHTISNIQLEEGSTATSYEPYKGVTIEQSIDSIPLTSNMFEQGAIDDGNTSTIVGMSYQQMVKTNMSNRYRSKQIIPVKPNGKYILNCDAYAVLFDKNGAYVKNGSNTNIPITNGTEFTIPSYVYYIAPCLKTATINSNLTLQEVPQEIVLRSLPNGVKDTLNLTTGEYVQRIGEVVLNGSEAWEPYRDVYHGSGVSTYQAYCTNRDLPKTSLNNKINCDGLVQDDLGIKGNANIDKYPCNYIHNYTDGTYSINRIFISVNKEMFGCDSSIDAINSTTKFRQYLQQNPITVQYELATPIIKKVNLTNTTKLPSYASTTHYDTTVKDNSLVPNIKIPSTIDYNVAIKPSTEYTIRANATSAMSVDLGGSTGTLVNGKVTLTTPSTLAHNSLKLGNGKAKEVMVIEGSEIKDNVPFFNGMKNVQMGGSKLVNIARGATLNSLVTANANKTQFTYTGDGTNWGKITFDKSLLKPNTKYTIKMNVISNCSSIKVQLGHAGWNYYNINNNVTGIISGTIISPPTVKCELPSSDANYFDDSFCIYFRNADSGQQTVIQNPMIIEGDWTHLDEIPFIESEMIIEQPIIRSQGKNLFDGILKNGFLADATGQLGSESSNHKYGVSYIKINPTKQYCIYAEANTSIGIVNAYYYDINKQYLGFNRDVINTTDLSASKLFTPSYKNASYIRFRFFKSDYTDLIPDPKNIALYESDTLVNNYIPFKQHTLSSNRVIGYEEGVHYGGITGIKSINANFNSIMADVEGLSIAYVTNGSSNFSFWDKDMVFISGKSYLDTSLSADNKNGFIQVPSNAKYMKFASANTTGSPTDYTKATVTGELPLRSLPNGVCDSFNLVTGEYVQRVGEVVLDGSSDENWTRNNDNDAASCFYSWKLKDSGYKLNGEVSCDYFKELEADSFWLKSNVGIFSKNGNKAFYLVVTKDMLSAYGNSINNYLSQNPITVQYELATPIVRKIGLTAKGNYKEVELNGSERVGQNPELSKKFHVYDLNLANDGQQFTLFTNKEQFTVTNSAANYTVYKYKNGADLVMIINENINTVDLFKRWLSQNPIKVGHLTNNSASLYSNIQKPIFFNNVKVQFMNDNVDIQPTLTLQSRSRNSYVMDMMKANTVYTSKFLQSASGSTFIDGIVVSMKPNNTFTSPSTLTNKLMVTPINRQEFMIIEGDVTGKAIPYYKGIRSSFDNTDKVEVLSISENLFNINTPITKDNQWSTIIDGNSVISTRTGDGGGAFGAGFRVNHVKPNTVYTLSWSSGQGHIYVYNNSGLWGTSISAKNTNEGNSVTFTTKSDTEYITIGLNYGGYDVGTVLTTTDIKLEEGSVATPYKPHKENSTIVNMPTQLETVEVVKPVIEVGSVNADNGNNSDDTTKRRSKDYIPVKPGMILTFMNGNTYRAENIYLYGIDKNYLGAKYTNGSGDLTIPNNCYFIRFYSSSANTSDITVIKKQYKPIALNELPNGVKDELIIKPTEHKAKLIQRVVKITLDGTENWGSMPVSGISSVAFTLPKSAFGEFAYTPNNQCIIVSKDFKKSSDGTTNGKQYNCFAISNHDTFHLQFVMKEINSMSKWTNYLKNNPITMYLELAEPVVTEIQLKGYPFVYKDGSVQLNTEIPHTTKVKYNVNQEHLINGQNETIIRHDKQIDNLYDYIELYLEEEYRMELFRMQLELSL